MARTQSVTILFCDLVASTERRARLGDDAFDEFAKQLFVVLRGAIEHTHGREVSNAGDGMMVVFPESVIDAISCATEMHTEVAKLDPDDPPRMRIGISCGEVAQDGDNYSGMPIVEAARLEAKAAPGQTLANSIVRSLVGTRRALRFRDVGALSLKGIPEPLATVEVVSDDVIAPAAVPSAGATRRRRGPLVAGIAAVVVVAVVVAALVVSGGSRSTHASSAATRAATPDYPVSYATKPCPSDAARQITGLACGTLTVPEDRSKPHGRVVQLDVWRAPALGQATGDPVVDFGADKLATSPARDHSEEIQVAQRGWGPSDGPASKPALTCPEYVKIAPDSLAKPSGDSTEQQRDEAALHACYLRWTKNGVDPSQYNYLAVGDDMADLIRALHFRHVNLVSGYVVSISALEVIRQLPDTVRTLTLQEPVAPNKSAFTNPTKFLSDAFNNYVALCRADAACHASFPNLASDVRRDVAEYQRTPRLVTGDDGSGDKHAVLLDGARLAAALQNALFNRDTYPLVAAAIAGLGHAGAADAAAAGQLVDANRPLFESDFAWGAELSGWCSYEVHTVDAAGSALARQAAPEFSGVDAGDLAWQCKAWPVRGIDKVAFDDPSTTVPTFIVTPTLLPSADPQWADAFRAGLPNATLLTFPTLDGGVLSASDPPCLASLRRAFLAAPTQPLATSACERQSPPIHFLASLGG